MPEHNIYVPVTSTIMPRPKFRDYSKEDQEGKDFTYRSRASSSIQPGLTEENSVKPAPFSPALPIKDQTLDMTYKNQEPLRKWGMPYRMNKNKRTKQFVVSTPQIWRFSTFVGTQTLSAEQEE